MKKILLTILLFINGSIYGQKLFSQEEQIYNAVDVFVANPDENSLKNLSTIESDFWKNPKEKTKEELLAIVVLNCNKGYYENKFGKINQAISSYENAWKTYQKNKLKNYNIVEYCLKPLGNLYTIIGDYDNAENTIKQYYYIANTEKNQSQKIAAILNLSNVYQNTGKVKQAIDLLEKTLQTEKLSGIQKGVLLNNLGNNYMINAKEFSINPEAFIKAENCFKTALKLLEAEKNQSETLANCYLNLASLNSQRKDFKQANAYFAMAKKIILDTKNQNIRTRAKLYYEEASLLFKQKKYAKASTTLSSIFKTLIPDYSNKENSLPNQNSLYPETALLDALDLQAEIYSEQNQPKKALEAYTLSLYIEDLFSNLLVYENSKIINQVRIRNRTEKCLSIYSYLYQKENNISHIEHAFQLSERTKSGVLKNYLSNKKKATREEKLLLEQLQNANNEIVKEQQKGDIADVSKINEIIKKQNHLMLSLKKLRAISQPFSQENIDLKSLYSKLKKDKAIMVEYFSGNDKMYSFTLENQQIKMKTLDGSTHSSAKIYQFLLYFSDANTIINDVKGYNKFGHILNEYLKLPPKSSYKNLIIIPDGMLNFLPFEALITQESTTTNFAKMHYLLNDYRIAYNNSATFYLNQIPHSSSKKTVLGLFPVFEKTAYELTFSKKEMQSIKSNFEGLFFENSAATFDNFKANAANYSILHLSTHASSGDTESPASIKFYDQEILYSELYNLKINPDLVVLSACETGIGKLYKSEGAMSIARGFQFAGTQNLLFSLWKVNDYTTSVFMDIFYKKIKNNESYFEANTNAKLDYLKNKSISNAKKTPYYWSAFVYYGEIKTAETPINFYFYILGLLVIIGLYWVFNRLRK